MHCVKSDALKYDILVLSLMYCVKSVALIEVCCIGVVCCIVFSLMY